VPLSVGQNSTDVVASISRSSNGGSAQSIAEAFIRARSLRLIWGVRSVGKIVGCLRTCAKTKPPLPCGWAQPRTHACRSLHNWAWTKQSRGTNERTTTSVSIEASGKAAGSVKIIPDRNSDCEHDLPRNIVVTHAVSDLRLARQRTGRSPPKTGFSLLP
jgi:hypothetical protein